MAWALAALVVIGAPLQVATQRFAAQLGCHEALGSAYRCVHPPWRILLWAGRFRATYPAELGRACDAALWAGILAFACLAWARTASAKAAPYLHGSARWAQRKDLERAGLLPRTRNIAYALRKLLDPGNRGATDPPTVYVGAWRDRRGRVHYLTHNGPEHVLAMAPTRSGKGVGLVVPTLLSWPQSALVLDLKGELYELTAGWRHTYANQTVLRLDFASSKRTVRWNPLAELRMGTDHEVGDVQSLALMLMDPDGQGVESDHWRSTAMGLLVGVILHVLHTASLAGKQASLASIDSFLSDRDRPIEEVWLEMVRAGNPVVANEGRKMLNRPEEEAGSVLSTAQRALSLYLDPVVAHNTAASDFRIRDLMHGAAPVTLYLITQPADKDRLMPLIRIFISMAIRLLADRLEFEGGRPKPTYNHKLLLMLDEFVALRRLPILQEALAYMAGYGLKAYLICQDRQQLTSRDYGYGPDETITANAHIQCVMRPDKLETAEYVSRKTGETTVAHTQITRHGWGLFARRSRTMQHLRRALLTPDECMRLPGPKTEGDRVIEGGEMLVFAAGMPTARGPQPLYFQDPVFTARAEVDPPDRPLAKADPASQP